MADKRFNRFRNFNYKTFSNLSLKSQRGIIRLYDCVLGACKKYNPVSYYGRRRKK